ncbi:neuroglobin-like isoform X1 [Dendronephthya gigantea]|uniref:neuroglobin-like isoform X1 n=1 Tax=Dendronephthya gigantea TaxID=151771 RepID=UPI00106A0FA7|nr:neuroglobin-like isoform X1 [Dendronephthya gigantea]
MGCNMSADRLSKIHNQTVIHTTYNKLVLTDDQKQLIRYSWEFFEPKKTAIGRKMFVNLFQVYPEMQNLFPEFRGQGNVDKLETTQFLNGHAKRLMTAVENSVNALGDFESCSTYLQELGRRHKIRKLKPHYLERMGAAMMLAFKELYPDLWTEETDEAWNKLYKYISDMMVEGLNSP